MHLTHPKIQDFPETYQTTGHFIPYRSIDLSPPINGIVQKINFKPGQFIRKGTYLITLDDHIEYAQMSQQRAEYQLQQKLFHQIEQLFNKKVVSETQFLEAQTRLEKSKAIYKEAYWRWKLKTIRAPFNGIIGMPYVYPGSYVNPGQTKIARLEQVNPTYLEFNIPETIYPYVKIGQEIIFSTSHLSKKTFTCQISYIEPYSDSLAHTILVRAKIKQPSKKSIEFLPGEFAEIRLKIHSNAHSLTIPSQAVIFSPKGTSVFIAKNQKEKNTWLIEEKPIVVGLSNHQQTRIKKGIEIGDWIVDSGTQKIADGSLVQTQKQG